MHADSPLVATNISYCNDDKQVVEIGQPVELVNGRGEYDQAADRRDMTRLGRPQQTKKRFQFFSIVGYMVILAST